MITYDPTTGNITLASGKVASTNSNGYITVWFQGKQQYAHRVAWYLTYGTWPIGLLDHINQNKKDNRIINLRLSDEIGNGRNRISTTGSCKGVQWRACRNKYYVRLQVDGKMLTFGQYEDYLDACAVAIKERRRLHGEYYSHK